MSKGNPHAKNKNGKSKNDSWATPLPYYLALDSEYDFAADMCASERNAKHPLYWTEADDALSAETLRKTVERVGAGDYVWIQPPYSNITPWVELATRLQENAIGSVLLVMSDSSVGWYEAALRTCQEIREVIRGRIGFINEDTGLPGKENNKGSYIIVYHPFGEPVPIEEVKRTYVVRDELRAAGLALMVDPERNRETFFPGAW